MQEIYNEGRVVGLSQWELYVRQLLSTHPEATPMTEREWLVSTLGECSSMILKIASGTTKGYHDYILPENSELCGCTMIHGYLFEGDVVLDDERGYWATNVDSYGKLISNTQSLHPTTPGTSAYVPTMSNPEDMTPELKERCKNYLKLTSGLMFQPGQWVTGVQYVPALTESDENLLVESGQQLLIPVAGGSNGYALNPDLSSPGFIRIAVNADLTSDVYVYFHGFVYKPWMRAGGGTLETTNQRPQDGDFLGPTIYPWACPVMFTVTTNIIETTNNGITIDLVE
jgi:hypothetical protein